MATRSRGLSAGFDWLARGIGMGFRYPKPLFGASALVLLAVLIPTLITLPIQIHAIRSGTPLSPSTSGWMTAFSMLFGLFVLPLYAGYLQVADALENRVSARAGDVIRPYRQGKALRIIGYGIVMLVVYIAVFGLVFVSTGGGVVHWYLQAVQAQANHLPPPTTLPDGIGITVLLAILAGIFMMGFYSIGLGQVALGNRSAFGAIADGLIGALKNALPLLMLTLGLILVWIAAAICLGILVLLFVLIGKLLGLWLMFALIIPFYIALLLIGFTAMFGVMYHLWRDVCGGDNIIGTVEAMAA